LISFDTSVRSLRGTASTTSRELGFAILAFWFLLSFWTWQAQRRGEIFVPLKSIPAHGRAFVFLTAIGGGLAVGVIFLQHLPCEDHAHHFRGAFGDHAAPLIDEPFRQGEIESEADAAVDLK
jgi:hypothetical protein